MKRALHLNSPEENFKRHSSTKAHSHIFFYGNEIPIFEQNHFWEINAQTKTEDPCSCWLLTEQKPPTK